MADCNNIIKPSDSGGSLSCAELETTLTEVEVMCSELNGILTTGSPPSVDEQLNVTAASITISGIHNAGTVIHVRNGVIQNSNHYSITTDTITPTVIGGGSYADDNLLTFYW